jgi:hypothetical protein
MVDGAGEGLFCALERATAQNITKTHKNVFTIASTQRFLVCMPYDLRN